MVKVLLICISSYGNTRKIAEAMAEAVGGEIHVPSEVSSKLIEEYDVIGLGSGIYYGKHHKSLFRLLNRADFRDKRVFIFYTSGFSRIPFLNGCEDALKKALIAKGAKVLGVFGCRGYCDHGLFKLVGGINKSRPNENDLNRAKNFITRILKLSK